MDLPLPASVVARQHFLQSMERLTTKGVARRVVTPKADRVNAPAVVITTESTTPHNCADDVIQPSRRKLGGHTR